MINKQCTLCHIAEFKVREGSNPPSWEETKIYTRGIHYGSKEKCIEEFNRNAKALMSNLSREGKQIEVRWNFEGEEEGYYSKIENKGENQI